MNMAQFFSNLEASLDDSALTDLCRRTVLHGTPAIFTGREDEFYDFRKRIAEKFQVSFHEVYIVGSAKLGFSPFKRKKFDLESDIDVAIVSRQLFDEILDQILYFQMEIRSSRQSITDKEMVKYHSFLEYIALGWMRPDKLPVSISMRAVRNDWFAFFGSLSHGKSEVGNYKVSAGVFKDYKYLEMYTMSGMKQLKNSQGAMAR